MNAERLIDQLCRILKEAVREDPNLAARIEALIPAAAPAPAPRRRAPSAVATPAIAIYAEFKADPEGLRTKLRSLDAPSLKALNKEWALMTRVTARDPGKIADQLYAKIEARMRQGEWFQSGSTGPAGS